MGKATCSYSLRIAVDTLAEFFVAVRSASPTFPIVRDGLRDEIRGLLLVSDGLPRVSDRLRDVIGSR